MTGITKYKNIKNRRNLKYPSVSSSISPVPHSDDLPIPSLPEQSSYEEDSKKVILKKDFSMKILKRDHILLIRKNWMI
jgi:hypothetical protein